MPKRVLKHHLDNVAKGRRKSMLVENKEDENKTKVCNKQMKYNPSNRNNEIERLLMHNSKSLIYGVDHSVFPAFNVGMWPQENSGGLINYPTCAFSAPRALFVANKQCEKIDICYKRPMNAHFFKTRMKMTRTAYRTALKSNKNIRSVIKDNIYHYSVFEMAERLYMRPDPFFQSSYDFYFTGGNLTVLPTKNIVHAGGEKLQEMLLSETSIANTNCLLNVASSKTSENSEIFEYQPLIISHNSNRQNYFITRQRNLISFSYINSMKEVKPVTQFRTSSTPFISFAQSQRDIDKFIVTTLKQHVRLYNLSGSAPDLVKLFEISPNGKDISWNTVKSWRENTFMYANEKQFFMIDVRTTPEQWLKEVFFANNDATCEHISAVLPSDFNNLFYVATNHKLQCIDIRHLKKDSFSDSIGGISRWTHQLHYAPLMMDTFRTSQTEYIALSSPLAGDLHICQLSRERNVDSICLDPSVPAPKHIYSSPCLPYQPPSLLEAYEHSRLSGKCLRPEANLETRIKCCTTGMKFFQPSAGHSNSGVGQLLFSNSNGDVFAHTLSKRENNETEERCNKHSDEFMTDYEQKICNQVAQPLNYTELKNMKGLRKVFLCKALSSVKNFNFDEMENMNNEDSAAAANTAGTPGKKPVSKRLHLGRWQKSLSTLHSYKDALVSNLLSVWDIDVEEENKIRLGAVRNDVTMDSALKVENWMQKNTIFDAPMLSIPLGEITRQLDDNTSNIFDTSLNINQTQTTVDFENAVHSTQIIQDNLNNSINLDTSGMAMPNEGPKVKIKNKKKTKKYVKGF